MNENEIILELDHLVKKFNGYAAVDDISLKIKKGEFITLLGPSGCGKSTTLRMVAGLETPTSGRILLNGKEMNEIPPHKRPLNMVFQRYALFQHLDVYDNIAFGLKLKKVPYNKETKKGTVVKYRSLTKNEIAEKVEKALKLVDLEGFETRDVSTLSGGQQQRIAIARAIVNEPEILLLDEPLGALDLKMRKEMQLELKEMHKKLGITFIYITHDQEEALTMSDTVVVMRDGCIQQVGTPIEIYNEPNNSYVADFIGESNIYVGTMIGDRLVRFLGANWECVDDFQRNEKVDVVVRPEDIEIHKDESGAVKGTITNKIFKGMHFQYTVMVGNSEVEIQSTLEYPVGMDVTLSIQPDLIQIMKKDFITNVYEDAYISKNGKVVFANAEWDCDLTKLASGSYIDIDGYFVTKDHKKYDLTDLDVIVHVDMPNIEISDDLEAGNVTGKIIQMVWKGDHYQVIVRTDDEEDFVVDTEWTWNEFDTVSVSIKPEYIKLKIKEDLSSHEIQ